VIGLARTVAALPAALARCKRFARHIEVPAPTKAGREAVLRDLLRATPGTWRDVIADVAAKTPGWLPRDHARLCRAASLLPLGRLATRGGGGPGVGGELPGGDLLEALRGAKPVSSGEVPHHTPSAQWEQVAGYAVEREQAFRLGDAFFGGAAAVAMARLGVGSPPGRYLHLTTRSAAGISTISNPNPPPDPEPWTLVCTPPP
jgi:SpoVK/Ycf46/Vps4 family AAA+-type ATPase